MKKIEFKETLYKQELNRIINAKTRLEKVIDDYNRIEALDDLKTSDFVAFKESPREFYENKIEALKKRRFGSDKIDEEVFRKLYNLHKPDFLPPFTEKPEYLILKDGEIIIDQDMVESLKANFTVTTNNPHTIKQLEAVEALIKQYNEVFTLLYGETNKPNKHDFKELGKLEQGFDSGIVERFV